MKVNNTLTLKARIELMPVISNILLVHTLNKLLLGCAITAVYLTQIDMINWFQTRTTTQVVGATYFFRVINFKNVCP